MLSGSSPGAKEDLLTRRGSTTLESLGVLWQFGFVFSWSCELPGRFQVSGFHSQVLRVVGKNLWGLEARAAHASIRSSTYGGHP